MASTITALTGGGGVAVAGDTSGVLELKTNNGTTAMTIDTAQNVGIGTSSPVGRFIIQSDDNSAQQAYIRNINAGSSAYSILNVGNDSSATSFRMLVGSSTATAFGGANSANLVNSLNSPMTLWTNNTERMRIAADGTITASNGNVLLVSGTAVSATGTSIDFTGIPAWVKRITVILSGVSSSGTSPYLLQLGSGSVTTSGYLGATTNFGTGVASSNNTTGCGLVQNANATSVYRCICTICNITGNTWVASGTGGFSDFAGTSVFASSVSLSGTLDRVRITTVNGTDTFDAGTINILYE